MKGYAADLLPRRFVDQYHGLSYDEFVGEAWYAAPNARDMAATSNHASDTLSVKSPEWTEGVALMNKEEAERIPCNWRHKGMFPFPDGPEAYTIAGGRQAASLRTYIATIGHAVRQTLNRLDRSTVAEFRNAPYPLAKGKGAPFWFPGTDRKAAVVLAALAGGCRSVEDLNDSCHKAGARVDLCILVYTRIQGARKKRMVYAADVEGRPRATGVEALLPKVRKVQAVPFIINFLGAPLASAVMFALRRATTIGQLQAYGLPPLATAIAECRRAKPGCLVATDFSAFDDHVTAETIDLVIELVLIPALALLERMGAYTGEEAVLVADGLRSLNWLDLMLPPLSRNVAAERVRRKGGIVSGTRFTSIIGTVVSQAIAALTARAAGGRVMSCNFSDDVIYRLESRRDAERVVASVGRISDMIGMEVKLAPDETFLMRNARSGKAYLSRMVASTLQKEHNREPRHAIIAALGIAARRALLSERDAARYEGWLATTPSPSLRLAHRLSHASLGELAMAAIPAALATSGGARQVETLEELLDTADDLDLPGSVVRALESGVDRAASGASDTALPRYMPVSELIQLADTVGHAGAVEYVREHAYWR